MFHVNGYYHHFWWVTVTKKSFFLGEGFRIMTSITEATMIHHVAIVLILLWLLNSFDYGHPLAYFLSLIYLYLVCTIFCFFHVVMWLFWFNFHYGLIRLFICCWNLKVHEQYITRLQRKLQFEEKRQSNQRRVSIFGSTINDIIFLFIT